MIEYTLLVISLFAGLFYNIVRNFCMKRYIKTQADNYLFNAVSGLFTSLTLLVVMIAQGGLRLPSVYTFLFGLLFGAVTALAAILNMRALGIGPMSYTTVIISCSMIIPALYGLTRGDTLSWVHYVGIVMMILCMILSVTRDGEQKKANAVWFACCMFAFVLTGSIGIMQQIHQGSAYKDELNLFLLVAFLFSVVFSYCGHWYYRAVKKESVTPAVRSGRVLVGFCAVTGICVAAANVINLYLSGAMNPAVFFPVINGGGLILSALAGIILFREKFSALKWVGLCIGCGATLLLCLEKVIA